MEVILRFWPEGVIAEADLRAFAGVLTSTAVGMTALAAAAAALLYSLLSTPMMKALHERGALNRVVFDVLVCAAFWLLCLCTSLLAAFPAPSEGFSLLALKAACGTAIAALMTFLPIGRAFWVLMRSAHKPIAPTPAHDWTKKTQI